MNPFTTFLLDGSVGLMPLQTWPQPLLLTASPILTAGPDAFQSQQNLFFKGTREKKHLPCDHKQELLEEPSLLAFLW